MDRPQFLRSIVTWLRAGYPNGVPTGDYIPLVALLRRQLTDDEVREISETLMSDAALRTPGEPISRVDVGVLITKVTEELPSEDDITRVREILQKAGWPVDTHLGGSTDQP